MLYIRNMRIIFAIAFFSLGLVLSMADQGESYSRGSIPGDLLRPRAGEAPRFPIDTVIGELGQGKASAAAFSFARSLMEGFTSGNAAHRGLAPVNAAMRENYLSVLKSIQPANYRLGGGREEPDGSTSFLVRFIGSEWAITGELFVRYVTRQVEEVTEVTTMVDGEEVKEKVVNIKTVGNWTFDDLILEEAKRRDEEHRGAVQRFDFSPYERFF